MIGVTLPQLTFKIDISRDEEGGVWISVFCCDYHVYVIDEVFDTGDELISGIVTMG